MVQGLTGRDDRIPIERCLSNASDLAQQFYDVMEEFTNGDIDKAFDDLENILKELPNDFGNCTEIEPELDRIEIWAGTFNITKVVANFNANKILISALGAAISGYITTGDWYKAGQILAQVLVLLMGPVQPTPAFLKEAVIKMAKELNPDWNGPVQAIPLLQN